MATQYTAGLTSGQVLTAATMNSIGAAWESYTPTLTQSGAVTKTVTYAKYTQINKLVIVQCALSVTGAGTAGQAVKVGLPMNASTSGTLRLGSGNIYDASTGTQYGGIWALALANNSVWMIGDWSGGSVWGGSPNIALANGDNVELSIMYEAA